MPTIEEVTVPVEENGATVEYKINFGWKNVGVITVYKGTSSAILQAKNSTNWNEAVAKYSVALHQLGADTIAYAKKAFRQALVSEATTYWKAAFGNATNSEWTKITKNTAFKKISAEYARTLINDFLTNINDDFTKTNLREYGTLAILYKNLADAVGNRQSDTAIKMAAEKFSTAAKKILGSSFIELPDPASDFHYSANLSEVTIPAGVGKKINSDDYETKVKKIDATAYTSRVTINGNANANVIYGGSGVDVLYGGLKADTIYGGKGNDSLFGEADADKLFGDAGNDTLIGGAGNDCLTGGAGADVFYYENGDGNDVITDYVSGQDKIKIGSGVSVTGYSVKNGNAVLTLGKGRITLKGVGDNDIDIVRADNSTITYGIAAGLEYNKANLSDSTAVTITSEHSGKTFSAGYSSLVTIDASGIISAIELVGNAKNNRILGGGGADILNGGNGKDTIVGGAGDDTLIGGKGNDCLTGGAGSDVFYYTKGDGADIITDFTTGDKIYIDGATSVSGSLKNNDVTFKVSLGNTIKVTGARDREIIIEYSNGTVGKYLNGKLTETYRVNSGGSQVDVIHKFVKSLDETNLSGISAVNEAVAACSNYTGLQNLIDNFISDCKKSASGDAFLKNYCGIDLDNDDTGAITGADAGGSTVKNAASVVPESTTKYVYPDSTSLTYKGLTLNVPTKSSLSSMQQNIVAGLNSWWLKESLDLVEKSYGLSFAESDATFKNATLSFYNNSLSSVNYKTPNCYGYSEWNSGDTTNRFKTYFGSNLFSSMDTATADGRLITSSSSEVLYLDRFFAVNFAIAAQAANTKYYNNLPNFIRFGISVLSVGGDDIYQSEIRELAGNSSKLASYVSTSNLTSNVEYDWAGGYMLFRYLAKQAASNPAPASGSNSAAPWFADDNNFATGADLDSLIEVNSVGNISASNSSTNFAQDTAVLAENQIDIRAEMRYDLQR